MIPLPPPSEAALSRHLHQGHCPRDALSRGTDREFFWDAGCRGFGIRALRSGGVPGSTNTETSTDELDASCLGTYRRSAWKTLGRPRAERRQASRTAATLPLSGRRTRRRDRPRGHRGLSAVCQGAPKTPLVQRDGAPSAQTRRAPAPRSRRNGTQTRHCGFAGTCRTALRTDRGEPCTGGTQRVVDLGAANGADRGREQSGFVYHAQSERTRERVLTTTN